MRLTCNYCGSEVEVEGNMTCPFCGGSLSQQAKKERERLEKEAAEEKKRQDEQLKREYEDRQNERWGRFAFSLLPFAFFRPFARLRRIFYDLGAFFKVLGFIVAVIAAILIYRELFMGG